MSEEYAPMQIVRCAEPLEPFFDLVLSDFIWPVTLLVVTYWVCTAFITTTKIEYDVPEGDEG